LSTSTSQRLTTWRFSGGAQRRPLQARVGQRSVRRV